MSQRLVSIITPCYNAEKYIRELLNSVLIQTYKKIEMIIIDDGSTDDSAEIIKSYIPKFKKRGYSLSYIYQENQGQSVALNNGLRLITGDYLVWPDADDYYAAVSSITEMAQTLEGTDDSVSMVRVQYTVLDEAGNVVGHHGVNGENRYKDKLFESCLFEFGTTFWGAAGGYMVKTTHLDRLIPGRKIYAEKNTGQNWQLCLPLLYLHRCLTIEKDLYNIVAHADSHSRELATNNKRQKAYYRTIKNTLKTINLPKDYRKSLLRRVRAMTKLEKNQKIENRALRRRAVAKRFIRGVVPHAAVVVMRKKGIISTPPVPSADIDIPKKSLLEHLSDYDDKLFDQGFAHGDFGKENIEGWLLFCAHVLEKAMSRVDFEEGHNFFRLEQIAGLIKDYDSKQFDKQSFAYRYALSSIKEYILLHKKHKFSVVKIKNVLGEIFYRALQKEEGLAGHKIITKEQKLKNKEVTFEVLQNNRYSVREFAKGKVDINVVRRSVQLAMKAPSVCNRQPVRVYNLMDSEKIKQVLAIQGGFHGYDMPSCLLLVTTDLRNYVGENERNQGFIDGGSFAMSLLLSLEYFGLAACPLHAMFLPDTDQKVREILGIKNPEYLIMFIAVGNFSSKNKVAVSSRYPASEITREYL